MTKKLDPLNLGYASALRDVLVIIDRPDAEKAVEAVKTFIHSYLADQRKKEAMSTGSELKEFAERIESLKDRIIIESGDGQRRILSAKVYGASTDDPALVLKVTM